VSPFSFAFVVQEPAQEVSDPVVSPLLTKIAAPEWIRRGAPSLSCFFFDFLSTQRFGQTSCPQTPPPLLTSQTTRVLIRIPPKNPVAATSHVRLFTRFFPATSRAVVCVMSQRFDVVVPLRAPGTPHHGVNVLPRPGGVFLPSILRLQKPDGLTFFPTVIFRKANLLVEL